MSFLGEIKRRKVFQVAAVYAVVDTWVLVSALRSSNGASHALLRAVRSGDLEIAISVALAVEYESVALRSGMVPDLGISEIQVIVDVLCRFARHQKIFYTWRPFLPDPDDDLVPGHREIDREGHGAGRPCLAEALGAVLHPGTGRLAAVPGH